MNVDKDEYKDYVTACKDKGFTVDISNSSNSFSAKNGEGYSLHLFYDDDDKEYSISLTEAKGESVKEETKEESNPQKTQQEDKPKTEPSNNNGLRPNFKKAMDDYEAFMNEYVEFMNKFNSNPTDTSLLKDYSNYLSKYTKAMDSFEKWDEEDMNDAETKYYLEVETRVNKKLLEIQ